MRCTFVSLLILPAIAAAAATCKPQSPGGTFENGITAKNCCADLTIIFARGTMEAGNVGTSAGPPFFQTLRQQLGNGKVTIQGVDYPASLGGLLSSGSAGSTQMASLIKQAKSQCPNTKIIASGYSQGAQVVHSALASAEVAQLVSGAVLFGDPSSRQAVGSLPASKVKQFCASGDVICQRGLMMVTAAHMSYGRDAGAAASAARGFAGV